MRILWVNCAGGTYHLFGLCPKCGHGMLLITGNVHESGIITGECSECKAEIAFYVHPPDRKVWGLAEPAEVITPKS